MPDILNPDFKKQDDFYNGGYPYFSGIQVKNLRLIYWYNGGIKFPILINTNDLKFVKNSHTEHFSLISTLTIFFNSGSSPFKNPANLNLIAAKKCLVC